MTARRELAVRVGASAREVAPKPPNRRNPPAIAREQPSASRKRRVIERAHRLAVSEPRQHASTASLDDARVGSRSARRKGRTRERLLDAALTVFVRRGYDGATTTEMASVADLGVGTFYCHFRDKRAAFEGLAHRASRSMLDRWLHALAPAMSLEDGIAVGLETTAAFWREALDRARLLLEDGPSFGTAAHVRLLDEVAATLRARFRRRSGTRLRLQSARALATMVVGLGVEIGRIILGSSVSGAAVGPSQARGVVAGTIALARAATTSLDAE